MNKQQFLKELKEKLRGLPEREIREALQFYSEIIDDRTEYCLSEEIAILSVGSTDKIAEKILRETPVPELIKEAAKPNRALRAWEIVLLVLGSPIWLSLLIAAVAVVLSVYVSLWSVIISLYAVTFSVAVCGVAGVLVLPIFALKGDVVQGVFLLGCGLVCAGLAILMFMLSKYATKGIIWLSCKIWFLIKRCFVRRGNSNENI